MKFRVSKKMLSLVALAFLVAAALVGATISTDPSTFAHARTDAATSQDATRQIVYIDPQGHVLGTWHGSEAERERIEKALDADHARQLQQKSQSAVSPNIQRATCWWGNDYYDLFNDGEVCFIQAGGVNTNIYNVYKVSTNNNTGFIQVNYGGAQGFNIISTPDKNTDYYCTTSIAGQTCTWYDVIYVCIDPGPCYVTLNPATSDRAQASSRKG